MTDARVHDCPSCQCPAPTYRDNAIAVAEKQSIVSTPKKRKPFLCWLGLHNGADFGLDHITLDMVDGKATVIRGCLLCGKMKRYWGPNGTWGRAPLARAACEAAVAKNPCPHGLFPSTDTPCAQCLVKGQLIDSGVLEQRAMIDAMHHCPHGLLVDDKSHCPECSPEKFSR